MKVQKMKVCELAERLGLKVTAGSNGLENEICGCYIGDLLSLAMARVEKDNHTNKHKYYSRRFSRRGGVHYSSGRTFAGRTRLEQSRP